MLGERRQQVELLGPQLQRVPVEHHFAAGDVDAQAAQASTTSGASRSPWERRRTAFTRATSSRGLNGFAM